jgi:hypothetical protein
VFHYEEDKEGLMAAAQYQASSLPRKRRAGRALVLYRYGDRDARQFGFIDLAHSATSDETDNAESAG